jgi:hypothetical protein
MPVGRQSVLLSVAEAAALRCQLHHGRRPRLGPMGPLGGTAALALTPCPECLLATLRRFPAVLRPLTT